MEIGKVDTTRGHRPVIVAISIDTEEDDWGSYARTAASTDNIAHLFELQDLFERWEARPTYLVNRAPLVDRKALEVLKELSAHESVEIGGHCHPWNTPPFASDSGTRTMMCAYSPEENRAKLREVRRCLAEGLGVEPKSFRAGRWGFGRSVAGALLDERFEIDCSVSPFIDWTPESGPDYSEAPNEPYRFDPAAPLVPDPNGALQELPTTIGFLSGDTRLRAAVRTRLERSVPGRLKVVGALDRAGLLARRWLSPETADGETMVRLADACVRSGQTFLQLTFHSCTLLPGATPFVRNEHDRSRFFASIERFLSHCTDSGFVFRTLSEAGALLLPDPTPSVRAD